MERIRHIFKNSGITELGALAAESLPPLLPVRSRARLPDRLRSVVFCLFPFYAGPWPERNVARYALGRDYHAVCSGMLGAVVSELAEAYPAEQFAAFVDASPFNEVRGAYLAGLGKIGRNGQLIHGRYGSYVFIGAVATSLELANTASRTLPQSGCMACGRCVAACPTGALTGDGAVDAARCRSAITQKRGQLSEWEAAEVADGGMVWGCDICTDICPHNAGAMPSPIAAFYDEVLPVLTEQNLSEVLATRAYAYRGEAVLRRNLSIIAGAKDA